MKIIIICIMFISFSSFAFAQEIDNESFSGTESGDISIATGGTIMATCTGNVPFKNLSVMGGFNNIIVDPVTGNLQLNIGIEKETEKNILNFDLTTSFNPEEVLSGFLRGSSIPLNDENLMLMLTSTDLTTGETINVGNEVRSIIESTDGNDIDVDRFIPVMGNLQVMTRNNLASGFIRIAFDNTNRAIEIASDVTGEDITIDENGEAALIARFENIPINGSFENLAGFDPDNLPRGVMLNSIPTGIDLGNLPSSLDSFNLPEGIMLEDIVGQIPSGFNLEDVLNLPDGFMVEDLANIPPFFGFTPEDLEFLPDNFNLDDLVNLPPGLDLSEIPVDKITDFIGVEIPEGINIEDIVNGIINGTINPADIPDINSNDPNTICQDGMIKPGFEPFVPAGFTCPTSSGGIPAGSSGEIPSGFDINSVCENGVVKPEFQPFVPTGFTCP